uniref:Uncharacterized protein n=1 Tax=Parascaris equorum TaxID=6256 RepID=A0A914RU86_PAREQ
MIRDQIVPRAVLFYTGEATDEDDLFDDYDGEDEDEIGSVYSVLLLFFLVNIKDPLWFWFALFHGPIALMLKCVIAFFLIAVCIIVYHHTLSIL